MPTATQNIPVPGVGGPASNAATAAQRTLSFDQAAHRGVEQSNIFAGVQLGGAAAGTAQVTLGNGPISLLPQGYMRGVLVDLTTSTAGVSGTANADYPFSLFALLRLHDTNGATMQEHTGFHNYLLNLFGSTVGESSDLSQWLDFSNSATSPNAQWYLPVELDADGFGALANQSAADTYKLDAILDSPADNYTASPTTNPIFTITLFIDYWTIPGAQDMLGRTQQQEPPFHGVAQYSYQSTANTFAAGQGTYKIGFTGNMYKNLIISGRATGTGYATGGARSAAVLPNPYTLRYDTRDLFIGTLRENRRNWFSHLNLASSTYVGTGIMAFYWNYGRVRRMGGTSPPPNSFTSWLPTLPATRFELTGTFGAGTIDALSSTISVAETNPALRGVSPNLTGYSPPVAAAVPGGQ